MSTASCTITGFLAKDPEVKEAGSSKKTVFSIPVERKRGDSVRTTWYRVNVWGKSGENAARMLTKGSAVVCTGVPVAEAYMKGDKPACGVELEDATWDFVGRKGDAGEMREPAPARPAPARPAPRPAPPAAGDDEPPF